MATICFRPKEFADHLHELVGYKAGMALSIEHMCDLLIETNYPDEIISSENDGIRVRAEEYEDLYYNLLYKVGAISQPYGGVDLLIDLSEKHSKDYGENFSEEIFQLFNFYTLFDEKSKIYRNGAMVFNPSRMIEVAKNKYGTKGLKSIFELLSVSEQVSKYDPVFFNKYKNYKNIINLSDLFETYKKVGDDHFFDQRFINYLAMNTDRLGKIHWRKFEELIGECFIKFGYTVELGSGSNDDGVDLRVWREDEEGLAPEYIIQCKRQKKKIEKVTIKGLYADVIHEKARQGLLVTTSDLSLGAKKTIEARTYPIREVNGNMIKKWLSELRIPGSGILRV